jgi:hypothetical protein
VIENEEENLLDDSEEIKASENVNQRPLLELDSEKQSLPQ